MPIDRTYVVKDACAVISALPRTRCPVTRSSRVAIAHERVALVPPNNFDSPAHVWLPPGMPILGVRKAARRAGDVVGIEFVSNGWTSLRRLRAV